MLDIKFYPKVDDIKSPEIIDISESCYEYLIESGFAKIGKSEELITSEEGEKIEIFAITLDDETRNEFRNLFQSLVLKECDNVCSKLDNLLSTEGYLEILNKLKTLNSLYKTTGDNSYYYLDRGARKGS
jgi:hypothetical protein